MSITIVISQFNDMHAHFRTSPLLEAVVNETASYCANAVVMPNTRPNAILTAKDAVGYRDDILASVKNSQHLKHFNPLMTIEIRDDTTPSMIYEACEVGVVAGKVYPIGVTTNSDMGLKNFFGIDSVFKAMEKVGMKLLIHGESPRSDILIIDREVRFLPTLGILANGFPNLKIVLEHITTKDAVVMIKDLSENVAATITGHHLYLTLNDVIGDGIRPHNFCMPIAKRFEDRNALVEAVISGNPKFFLGSDSAPHLKGNKENACGCAGIFTAPVLPSILVALFEKHKALELLEGFTSGFAKIFYGLDENNGTITLEKKPWTVPDEICGVVPFMAGKELDWKLVT